MTAEPVFGLLYGQDVRGRAVSIECHAAGNAGWLVRVASCDRFVQLYLCSVCMSVRLSPIVFRSSSAAVPVLVCVAVLYLSVSVPISFCFYLLPRSYLYLTVFLCLCSLFPGGLCVCLQSRRTHMTDVFFVCVRFVS